MKKAFLLVAYLCALIAMVLLIVLLTSSNNKKQKTANIPNMDVFVQNDNTTWGGVTITPTNYQVDFIKILSIAFTVKDEDLYIKYKLGGLMPKDLNAMPSFSGDKVNSAIYYLTLDDNYFDGAGQKNPGGPEANLKMSFYGSDLPELNSGKINVNGELVAGGPGYNYFVSKFRYRDLLLNQTGDTVVFTSYALATSDAYTAGASSFDFKNTVMMADKNPEEVKVKLSPPTQ